MIILFLTFFACAKIEPPPGGPPDKTPPHLVATVPESTAVLPGFHGDVEFQFDEVVSEGSQPSFGLGTSDLEKLILVSPTTRVPVIKWKRSRITVQARGGWRPNQVYRVELLPGIVDLRRNRSDSGRVVTFTTGAPLPTDTLRGRVIDWQAGRVAAKALIDAVIPGDSTGYRTLADSSGRFALGPIPRGSYVVYGVLDQNGDHRRASREAFDSVKVGADSTAVPLLWAFTHDTAGPRFKGSSLRDSVTATLSFTQPLDPYQRFDTSAVRVLALPDSTPVPVRWLLPPAMADSLRQAEQARADSIRAAADTSAPPALDTTRAAPPAPARVPARPGAAAEAAARDSLKALLAQRPALGTDLVLRIAQPFVPDTKYVVDIAGLRNANGAAADVRGNISAPKPAPADTSAADTTGAGSIRSDSTRARPAPAADSLFQQPDTTRRSPP